MNDPKLLPAAFAWTQAGYSVVPTRTDGSKAPAAFWKQYMTTPADPEQIKVWLSNGAYDGIGLVCGAVSGHLEMFELEGRAVTDGKLLNRLVAALTDNGLGDLWTLLNNGYLELTPSGGLHWLYRVAGTTRPNLKLARDRAGLVLIETRGQGGYVVVAPSAGRTHPTGGAWKTLVGGPDTVPTITEDERDALHAVAAMLDETPTPEPWSDKPGNNIPANVSSGDRPGDDYNTRVDWQDILCHHGWERVKTYGGGAYGWRRPGKDTPGISATTNTRDGADRLYVFSSSTVFQIEKPYTKFAALCLLEHDGDWAAAAKHLREQGYGKPLEPSRPVDVTDLIAPTVEGNLATVADLGEHRDERPQLAVVTERTLERSDDGNALALIDRFGHLLRYCYDRGRWLAWDGTRWHWQPPKGGVAREYAKRLARAMPETDKEAVNHKRISMSAAGVANTLAMAETDIRIAVGIDALDAHAWELNTPTGIIDLRTGTLTPPDPTRLHTRVTLCAPDFDADDTVWTRFLIDTFGDDKTLIAYLRRLVGYSAVGEVGPHILPFCYGLGGNGKGAFLEALQKVLGDYATTAPLGFLMAKAHTQHLTEIARLAGARMVLCDEVNEDDRFDEAKVKQLTGGNTLTAHFMRQDDITFTPTHQLWLVGNNQPAVRTGGKSFWRRLRLIGFEREVPEDKIIDDLQGILARDHGPALLAWIARGAADYADGGLREPDSVKAATEEYAHDQDTVARFMEECCRLGGGDHVKSAVTDVRRRYETWCVSESETPVSAKALTQGLRNRYGTGEAKGTGGRRYHTNLTLLADDDDDPDPPLRDASVDQGWVR